MRISWIEVSDIAFLNQIEQALIQWFSPPLNGLRAPKAAKSALRERMEAVNQSEIVMLPLSEILSIRWTDERREKLKKLRGNTSLVVLAKTLAEYGILVSRQYLHRLESDPEVKGISPDLAEGLCQALKISLSELLFNERAPLAIWNK